MSYGLAHPQSSLPSLLGFLRPLQSLPSFLLFLLLTWTRALCMLIGWDALMTPMFAAYLLQDSQLFLLIQVTPPPLSLGGKGFPSGYCCVRDFA